jgi:sortase A
MTIEPSETPDSMTSPSNGPRHARSRERSHRWRGRAVVVLALVLILSGLGIGAHILFFLHRSQSTGQALIHQEEGTIAKAAASGNCARLTSHAATSTTSTSTSISGVTIPAGQVGFDSGAIAAIPTGVTPQGVLRIPSLGLVAPILQGVDDAELDVGVGHVTGSSWPGLKGTDVLSAHDVTWFSQIDLLKAGDTITIQTPCLTFGYTVLSHSVVKAGSPVYQSVSPRLFLVTCYPLNALFLTPNRYLVQATLSSLKVGNKAISSPGTTGALPNLPVPPALAAENLSLTNNEEPLGVLTLAGHPTPAWRQSSQPLEAESLALQLYFAALRASGQNQPSWWSAIAPGVPFTNAEPLVKASIVSVPVSVHPVLVANGATLTGATITSTLDLKGNDTPGLYRITMTAQVINNELTITGFTVQATT